MRLRIRSPLALLALLLVASSASGDPPTFPFQEGAIVDFASSEKLEPWLPPELYAERRFYFYEGMRMEIGPARRDYSPATVYRAATDTYAGRATIGPQGSLEKYVAGRPFDPDAIDCRKDPDAGIKHAWNFVHRWQGFGTTGHFRYVYVDVDGNIPLFYQGASWSFQLKHRPEPRYAGSLGDVFPGERRFRVVSFEVEKPVKDAGTRTLTYRYEASYGPPISAQPEDTWIWSPQTARVKAISQLERSRAVAGSDFVFDDLHSFSGLPARYEWECVEERPVVAPMNTSKPGYPYVGDGDYGPSRLSYASDRWELRDAIHLRMRPRNPEYPYARKEIWVDRETYEPLYSFAYDHKDVLWKVILHDHRWSEDDLGQIQARTWYPSWEGVSEPRDLRIISESILNVQTGTGNRWDYWDAHGAPPPPRELMRLIDLNSLKRSVWKPSL